MTASRDALELELKHNEKEFASLVTEELEQRFARFEDITLAAVSKMGPSVAASSTVPASAPYRTPTGQLFCPALPFPFERLLRFLSLYRIPAQFSPLLDFLLYDWSLAFTGCCL